MSDFGGGYVSAAAQTGGNIIAEQQLDVMRKQLEQLRGLTVGGSVIQGILGNSLEVLRGVQEAVLKGQEIIGPFVDLIITVEGVRRAIKDDVGLNLGSLVDVQRQMVDALKGAVGDQITGAIRDASNGIEVELGKTSEGVRSLGTGIEAAGKGITDGTNRIADEIRASSVFANIGADQAAKIRGSVFCESLNLVADPFLRPVVAAVELIVKELVCIFKTIGIPTANAITDVIGAPFSVIQQALVADLDTFFKKLGEATPENANKNASELLNLAFRLGMQSHFLAAAIEAFYPTKSLGLGQVAAFLVDLAGFGSIARAVVGTQIRTAVEIPMRYKAQRDHRPNILDLQTASFAWAELALSDDDFREIARLHGVPERMIPVLMEVADREPGFRELTEAFDDVEVDERWLIRAVQKAGYRGDNVERIASAIARRANRSWRSALVNEMRAMVKVGLRDVGWLETNLRALGFRRETVILISTSATLARAREHAEELAKSWEQLAKDQAIDLDDLELALAGLGFTRAAILERVSIIAARLTGQIAKEERAEIKQAVRKVQTTRTTQAIEAFRRGLLDLPQLEAVLIGLGIVAQQAAAMAKLEETKRAPRQTATEDEDVNALTEQVLETRRDEVLLLLRNGRLDEAQAVGLLMELGVDPELADAQVGKELARIKPPKELAEVAA